MSVKAVIDKLSENTGKVICGKDDAVKLLGISLLCGGSMLLEDIPGTGKTTLAKAAAASLDCGFKRIQFTPDLLPSDITGINVFSRKTEEFVFRKGPVFTNILLADEINRAAPRTQSALLECMEERQVTCDGVSMPLPFPFMVIATQNPIEARGTYPLPEAQLDRFFMSISLGYPERQQEKNIISGEKGAAKLEELSRVISADEIRECQPEIDSVKIAECVLDYILDIVSATRSNERLSLGISTRCACDLAKASKAAAAMQGRSFVIPDDVQAMLPHVCAHRIIPADSFMHSVDSRKQIITETADLIPVPKEELWQY
ncbi:MAG: AAA family ATPase [Porcipelethomonas sp.]